jgi:hypothetical protein
MVSNNLEVPQEGFYFQEHYGAGWYLLFKYS